MNTESLLDVNSLVVTRPVLMFPGYHVSPDGTVYGPKGALKANRNSRGYYQVSLVRYRRGQRQVRSHAVHRLVAKAWLQGYGREVNHKDGNKANNCAGNLEWVSSSRNKLHATALGLYPTGKEHYRWAGGGTDHLRRESARKAILNHYKPQE